MSSNNQTTISFNGIETDISLVGTRPNKLYTAKSSIIYLPGFGCDFTNHKDFKDLLVSYDYYAINFPAHGNSVWKNASDLTINHFANIVVDFIKNRSLSSVILIGHSSSAAVAALVANLLPEIVIANILISPIETTFQNDAQQVVDIIIPRLPENFTQLQRLKIYDYDNKAIANKFWDEYKTNKLAYFNKNAEPLSLILGYLLSPELKQSIEKLYSSINTPTLVVIGEADGLIRINDVANKMQKLIPHARFCIVPLAGHEPFLENPNYYYTNLIAFVDEVIANRK